MSSVKAPSTFENLPSFIRLPLVKARTGLSRSSIYLKVSQGKFPKPVNLGGRAVAWIDSEITEWINQRVRVSRGGAQ
jgi:prophage regulatory protein